MHASGNLTCASSGGPLPSGMVSSPRLHHSDAVQKGKLLGPGQKTD
jgi:hypothetical protein